MKVEHQTVNNKLWCRVFIKPLCRRHWSFHLRSDHGLKWSAIKADLTLATPSTRVLSLERLACYDGSLRAWIASLKHAADAVYRGSAGAQLCGCHQNVSGSVSWTKCCGQRSATCHRCLIDIKLQIIHQKGLNETPAKHVAGFCCTIFILYMLLMYVAWSCVIGIVWCFPFRPLIFFQLLPIVCTSWLLQRLVNKVVGLN